MEKLLTKLAICCFESLNVCLSVQYVDLLQQKYVYKHVISNVLFGLDSNQNPTRATNLGEVF